jgi:hypothetical protein
MLPPPQQVVMQPPAPVPVPPAPLPAVPQSGAPVPAGPAPATPPCPQCGTPSVWHAQPGKWGCDRCRAFLDTMAPALAQADVAKAAKRAQAVKMIVLGLVLCVIGIIITAATHEAAVSRGGGRYVIAYGPIIVGGIRFFQGLVMLA